MNLCFVIWLVSLLACMLVYDWFVRSVECFGG